jgi:hypothetical protein
LALTLWWRGGKEGGDPAGASSFREGGDESRALAALEKLRARFARDPTRPGKPIVLVDLQSTEVTDADLKQLRALHRLHTLNLSGTQVTDAGLRELAAFRRLETLNLWHTKVTDAGLKHLAALPNLEELTRPSDGVTESGLKELAPLGQRGAVESGCPPPTRHVLRRWGSPVIVQNAGQVNVGGQQVNVNAVGQ